MNRYSSFKPGQVWLDMSGKPIQAHGFSVFYNEKDGMYYWYGENKEKTKGGMFNKVWHWGVRCYTSQDLYNWEDKGLIIPPQPDDLHSPLHPTYCMDRPHIIYCEKTGKYVAWLKIMAGEVSQFMSVMQADDFMGPYTFVHKIYKPNQMDTGDFALAIDEKTKKAYFIHERPHFELVTAELERHFKDYQPDTSPREASPLPGKELKHSEKTCKSTYVWLPIEWQGEKPVIKWHDEWRIEDYNLNSRWNYI